MAANGPGESRTETMQQRPKVPISPAHAVRLWRQLSAAYLAGAVLSVALSFLPILRGDPRPIGLAVFCGIVGVLHLAGLKYQQRKYPETKPKPTEPPIS